MEIFNDEKQEKNKYSDETNSLIRVIDYLVIVLIVLFIICGLIMAFIMVVDFNDSFVSIRNFNIKVLLFLILYAVLCCEVIINLGFKAVLLKNLDEINKKIDSN